MVFEAEFLPGFVSGSGAHTHPVVVTFSRSHHLAAVDGRFCHFGWHRCRSVGLRLHCDRSGRRLRGRLHSALCSRLCGSGFHRCGRSPGCCRLGCRLGGLLGARRHCRPHNERSGKDRQYKCVSLQHGVVPPWYSGSGLDEKNAATAATLPAAAATGRPTLHFCRFGRGRSRVWGSGKKQITCRASLRVCLFWRVQEHRRESGARSPVHRS